MSSTETIGYARAILRPRTGSFVDRIARALVLRAAFAKLVAEEIDRLPKRLAQALFQRRGGDEAAVAVAQPLGHHHRAPADALRRDDVEEELTAPGPRGAREKSARRRSCSARASRLQALAVLSTVHQAALAG